MPSQEHREQLKQFLRARRAALSPETVGLPIVGKRLVKGLRREEVAQLSGVGLTWYTWLEQGRDIKVSAAVARRISRALRLDDADESYLISLCGLPEAAPSLAEDDMSIVNAALQTYGAPAFILDPLANLLAANQLALEFYPIQITDGPFGRNQLWHLFTMPQRAAMYEDYQAAARHFVRLFRAGSADRVNEPEFKSLVEALMAQSTLFRELWADKKAEAIRPRTMKLLHPEYGRLLIHSLRLPVPLKGGATIIMLVAADQHTKHCFSRLSNATTP